MGDGEEQVGSKLEEHNQEPYNQAQYEQILRTGCDDDGQHRTAKSTVLHHHQQLGSKGDHPNRTLAD